MATNRTTDFGMITIWSSTASPTVTTIPISGWMTAVQYAKVRATLEMRGKMGNLEVSFGYQTADSVASPDTAVQIGAYLSADGLGNPSAWSDISTITAGKQFIRFVLITRNTSGTTTNLARVGAVLDFVGF